MSRIHSIEIQNFRGIAACTLTRLGRVNVLIGKNNVGKSSVLEAMTVVFDVNGQRQDVRSRQVMSVWRESRAEDRDRSANMLRAGAPELSIKVTGTMGTIAWGARSEDAVNLTTILYQGSAPPDVRIGLFFPADATDRKVENTLWPQLIQTRIDRELSATVTDLFGDRVDSLQILPNGDLVVGLQHFGVRLDGQGSGFRSALRLLMVAAAAKDGILVIEEPECHQHAASLRRLAAALTAASKERNLQVFISTHSLECVRAFAREAEPTPSPVNGEQPADVEWPFVTLSLERQADGQVMARRLSKETVLGLDAAGADVRFLDEYQ